MVLRAVRLCPLSFADRELVAHQVLGVVDHFQMVWVDAATMGARAGRAVRSAVTGVVDFFGREQSAPDPLLGRESVQFHSDLSDLGVHVATSPRCPLGDREAVAPRLGSSERTSQYVFTGTRHGSIVPRRGTRE